MEKGVWIDTRKAYIVALTDETVNSYVVESEIEEQERYPGEGKSFGRFGDQYLNDEATKDNRHEHQVHDFTQKVMDELRDAISIVVFGPSGMKTELEKAIKSDHTMAGKLKKTVTTDNMTDNQKVAWVREFYGKPAPRKL